MNLKDQILNYQDLKEQKIKVPEWGDIELIVRELSSESRDKWEDDVRQNKDPAMLRLSILSLSIVDPNTMDFLFTKEDLKTLGKKSSKAIRRIYDVVEELNFGDNASIEDQAKN